MHAYTHTDTHMHTPTLTHFPALQLYTTPTHPVYTHTHSAHSHSTHPLPLILLHTRAHKHNTVPPAETCTDHWKPTLIRYFQWHDQTRQEWQLPGRGQREVSAWCSPSQSLHVHGMGTPAGCAECRHSHTDIQCTAVLQYNGLTSHAVLYIRVYSR